MDESQNSPTPTVINALPQRYPIHLPGKPVLEYCKYSDSLASEKYFTAAEIADFSSKLGIDISPFVNCCTDPVTLEPGDRKRKATPDSTSSTGLAPDLGLTTTWGIINRLADFTVVLLEVVILRTAIVKTVPHPPALTEAIENLVCN